MKRISRIPPPEETDVVRTTGRIKKPKAVFDPSDNYLPRAQRGSAQAGVSLLATTTAIPTSISDRKRINADTTGLNIIKKQFRLSTTSTPVTPTSTPPLADLADVCTVCQKREAKRGTYAKNKLISCLNCEKKVHKLCLNIDFEDFDRLRLNYKCDNCRFCHLCAAFGAVEIGTGRDLVTCSKCIKSYHFGCHIPNVLPFQQTQRNWKCNKCTLSDDIGPNLPEKTIREIVGAAESKTIAATLQQNLCSQSSYLDSAINIDDAMKKDSSNNEITVVSSSAAAYSPNEQFDTLDVKCWSVDQVTEFFAKDFPNEAYVFKEQEIDGMSLLLLKRSDIIKKLPIKLGPSLRIYSLILKIQTQLNDPTLGWSCGL